MANEVTEDGNFTYQTARLYHINHIPTIGLNPPLNGFHVHGFILKYLIIALMK